MKSRGIEKWNKEEKMKAIIIGCPGAGKSTFARKLQEKTNLPLYYLDMLWHKPDRTKRKREEFDEILRELMKKEEWIMDGNYQRTLEMRLKECDTVILLDYPVEVCLSGVNSRIGKKRIDMPWVEEQFDGEFKQEIIHFSEEKLPEIYQLLEKYKENRNIIIFHSREEAEEYLEKISI